MEFILGGLSAVGAGVITNPLDVLKTRLQLQGELRARGKHTKHYKNVFQAAYVVIKNDGVSGLQKGLAPAACMHFIRNSVRLGIYQVANDMGLNTDESGKTIFYRSALVSAVAGAAGAFCGSPLFLIKTHLQSQSAQSIAVGHQHGHGSAIGAITKIYKEHGVSGLWRGVHGNMLRALVGSSAQLTSFAMVKDNLSTYAVFQKSPVFVSFIAAVSGGMIQVVTMTPFDLVSTRLYNQPVDKNGNGLKYNGILDCFIKIGRAEGFFGFYKGMTANYLRLIPHGTLTLVFWDLLKGLRNKFK